MRASQGIVTDEVERLKRLLVACAKQSAGDEGAIPDMVCVGIGEDDFERLWESITDEEVQELAYGPEL